MKNNQKLSQQAHRKQGKTAQKNKSIFLIQASSRRYFPEPCSKSANPDRSSER